MSSKKAMAGSLKLLKSRLVKPSVFRESAYSNKACFSKDYIQYGFLETWDIAFEAISSIEEQHRTFHELILHDSIVKPYLDIEWYLDSYDYNPEIIRKVATSFLIEIFDETYSKVLREQDIFFSKCHRETSKGFKYSFHVTISTTSPALVFENANYASIIAFKLCSKFKETDYDPSIIDTGVYKKTQNMRLVCNHKSEESEALVPDVPEKKLLKFSTEDYLDYVITHINVINEILKSPEQPDSIYKSITTTKYTGAGTGPESGMDHVEFLLKQVKKYHPTAYFESMGYSGIYQFNYTDRNEPCFTCPKKDVKHDKIGFFAYISKGVGFIGCHSGRCINNDNKKIVLTLGALENNNLGMEKVSPDNNFSISPDIISECLINNSIGLTRLFEFMFLKPKRIKWISDGKSGTTYFWNGRIWEEDDFSFIERLLVESIVKIIRKFISNIQQNNDDIELLLGEIEEILKETDSDILEISNKTVTRLNNGSTLQSIMRFLKPIIRDTEFSKIMNIHPYLLACKNGMICLKTGVIRNILPSDNVTKYIDVEYSNPRTIDYSCFDNFVREMTSTVEGPCLDMYNYLRWVIGYALQGEPNRKLFFILYGQHGYNGKSLLLNTIKDVLDRYAVAMESSVVLDGYKKSAGSHSTELMQLENTRIGILSDTRADACINDGQIKMLTGGSDTISAREIYGKQKEFVPKFVPFISSNYLIGINLSDKAMYERAIFLTFQLSFVHNPTKEYERKADPSLPEKFANQKKEILAWLIDCSVYYNNNIDMKIPQCIKDAKEKYNKQINVYEEFIDTFYELTDDPSDMLLVTDVLSTYKTYFNDNNLNREGTKIYNPRNAKTEFNKRFIVKESRGIKYYQGIRERISVDDN